MSKTKETVYKPVHKRAANVKEKGVEYKTTKKKKPVVLTDEQIAAKRIVRSHPKENKVLARRALKLFRELKAKGSLTN